MAYQIKQGGKTVVGRVFDGEPTFRGKPIVGLPFGVFRNGEYENGEQQERIATGHTLEGARIISSPHEICVVFVDGPSARQAALYLREFAQRYDMTPNRTASGRSFLDYCRQCNEECEIVRDIL